MPFPGSWQSAAPQHQRNVNRGVGAVSGYGGSGYTNHQGVTQGPLITQNPNAGRAAAIAPMTPANYPAKVAPTQAAPVAPAANLPAAPAVQDPGYFERLLQGQTGNINYGYGGGIVGGGRGPFSR